MNHPFRKPIKTYGNKKFNEVIIPLRRLTETSLDTTDSINQDWINKESSLTEKKLDNNDSYSDPFETTFDRLLKNVRGLSSKPNVRNDAESFNSSDDGLNISKPNVSDCKSLLNEPDTFMVQSALKQTIMKKKQGMKLTKKAIVKKKKAVLQVNGKFKMKDGKTRKDKVSETVNFKTLSLNSEAEILETKKSNSRKKKAVNRKKTVLKKKEDGNDKDTEFCKNTEIKTCSVVLDELNVVKWNRKSQLEGNCEISTTAVRSDQFLAPHEMDSSRISYSCGNKYKNVISSTPNGKLIRPFTRLIALSPIPTEFSEKYADEFSISKNSGASMLIVQTKENLQNKSNTVENCERVSYHKLLSRSFTDSYNFSKRHTDNVDMKFQSSVTSACDMNYLNEKENVLSARKSLDSNLTNIEKDCSVVLEKYTVLNGKKQQKLRFSLDAAKSLPLFDDTPQKSQNLTHETKTEGDLTQLSTVHFTKEVEKESSNSEIYNNSFELSTKSSNDEEHVTVDEVEKDMSTSSSYNSLRTSGTSNDEVKDKSDTDVSYAISNNISNGAEESMSNDTNNSVNNSLRKSIRPSCSVLPQLHDPIRITRRRKYVKWDMDLHSIAEDGDDSIKVKSKQTPSRRSSKSRQTQLMPLLEESNNAMSAPTDKPIFLKPGKLWARSLSILNNVQRESNLDVLCAGKGKNWRYSVQDVLNMQKQGIIKSCIKRTDGIKELEGQDGTDYKFDQELVNSKGRTCDSINAGRVSRRISVRVVPIHRTIKYVEDAPFLEVYGIVPVKSQRFTLLNYPSVRDVQNSSIDDEIIKEPQSTAKEVILQRCSQTSYILFSTYFTDSYIEYCKKIGEGVYGEVFMYEHEDTKSVIKIIPIEGNECVNGERQKKFHEILSEIVIAMELHNLRFNKDFNTDGFVEVKNIKCIVGSYPQKLIDLWNVYDEEKRSDNDCPTMFDDDQLYIVLELGHGGQDLEAFVFNTAEEAHILFIQAALALAVAEKAVQFEHRDLHWGNILISSTNESYIRYKLNQKNIQLISKGVKVSIIDFTLSRVTYQGCSIFNDLALDPTLFTAQGEYQFEIYRLMKDKVKNDWQKFEPYTNVLWLHYTLDKMITAVRYRRKNLKVHKHGIGKLIELKNEILLYDSAFDFVTNCDKVVNLLSIY